MKALQANWVSWTFFAVILCWVTFGVVRSVYVFLYFVCFLLGAGVVLQEISKKILVEKEKHYYSSKPFGNFSTGIEEFVTKAEKFEAKTEVKFDQRLSGSSQIDNAINEYLIRDYVKDWYHDLSDDEEFLLHLRCCLNDVIRTFVARCKNIDWQLHLTSNVVEGFATHVRLFTRAQEKFVKLRLNQSKDASESASDDISLNSQRSENDKQQAKSLKDIFFEMEQASLNLSRELISCDPKKQRQFLRDFSEILLYLLLPKTDFHCRPLKLIMREVLVNGVFQPMIKLYSDPDYLNVFSNWLISDSCVSSDCFLSVLRHTAVLKELSAIREKAEEEFEKLRAKDTVGDDYSVKQQLSSMRYVKTLCEKRLRIHRDGIQNDEILEMELEGLNDKSKLYDLPLNTILHNNIALQIFIDYMQSVNGQAYLFFWLTIEGYRASAKQQIEVKTSQLQGSLHSVTEMKMLRDIGKNIYEQYLGKQANPRVVIDGATDRHILKKLSTGEPSAYLFDDIQQKVFQSMLKEEIFYPSFKTTKSYMKLLAELDLLRMPSINSDTAIDDIDKNDLDVDVPYKLSADINQTGICTEHGKTYALYAISVVRTYVNGSEEKWDTFRRYREFDDLHQTLRENNCNIENLKFPSKTFFKYLKEGFLEKRRHDLNQYLENLLSLEQDFKGQEIIHTFLDAKAYQKTNRTFASKVDSMMRLSMKNMTNFMSNAPDNFIDGIQKASDKVSDSFLRFSDVLPASSSNESEDNILSFHTDRIDASDSNVWLGVLILLLDEVFDLQRRNQWLRRQILAAIQQFIRTIFGDRMNKKISDHIEEAISPHKIAEYISRFRDNFWPQGVLAAPVEERNLYTKMRSRVLAKTKLIGSIPDELKPVLGNETIRCGMNRIFEMMQIPQINVRLCLLLFEGFFIRIFPYNRFDELATKYHEITSHSRLRHQH